MTPPPGPVRSYDRTAVLRALVVILIVAGGYVLITNIAFYASSGTVAGDAHAYWMTGQEGYQPYVIPPGSFDAFNYPPVFMQVIQPLTLLPWPLFAGLFMAVEAAALLWLLRPLGIGWMVAITLLASSAILLANITGLLAVAVVLALTGRPAAWALPILTKPYLGVGVLWHVVRRDWRAVAWATALPLAIALVSVALDPGAWGAWVAFMREESGGSGVLYPVAVAAAIGLVVWAALRDRAWLVPVALVLVTPDIGGVNDLVMLAAIPRLLGGTLRGRPTPGPH